MNICGIKKEAEATRILLLLYAVHCTPPTALWLRVDVMASALRTLRTGCADVLSHFGTAVVSFFCCQHIYSSDELSFGRCGVFVSCHAYVPVPWMISQCCEHQHVQSTERASRVHNFIISLCELQKNGRVACRTQGGGASGFRRGRWATLGPAGRGHAEVKASI